MGDRRHVDAAGGDVGRDQDLHLAVAQRHQAAGTQTLAQGTVQCHGREADLLQLFSQRIALDLGAGEDDRLVDGRVAQPMVKQLALVFLAVTPEQLLLDAAVLVLRRIDLHLLRRTHHALGQALDARREGGAEHHGLVALDGQLVDLGQVVRETQVEHAVGFVDDQELDLVELDLTVALQVEQAARGRDHQVGVLQLGDLDRVGNATDHVGDAHAAAMLDQLDRILGDLLREFARRAQDQGARNGRGEMTRQQRVLALGLLRCRLAGSFGFGDLAVPVGALGGLGSSLLLEQGVQHRQQEGSGLAATGLARHHQVGEAFAMATVHGLGDGGVLHQGRLGEAEVGNGLHQLGRQAQGSKGVRQCSGLRRSFCDVSGDGGIETGFDRELQRVSHVYRPGAKTARNEQSRTSRTKESGQRARSDHGQQETSTIKQIGMPRAHEWADWYAWGPEFKPC